jgi:hypothetical protein
MDLWDYKNGGKGNLIYSCYGSISFAIKSTEIIIIIFDHYCDMMATGCGKIWDYLRLKMQLICTTIGGILGMSHSLEKLI